MTGLYGFNARGPDAARRLVLKFSGPTATIYACPVCGYRIRVPRGKGEGRGYGLRSGGAAHSQMGALIRLNHPEAIKGPSK